MPSREPASPAAVLRRHPGLSATVGAVVLALMAVTLLGGWARSSPPGAVRVTAGTETDAAPFRVRLDDAAAQFVLAGDEADAGQAFVVVTGQLELTEPSPVGSTTVADAFTADLSSAYDEFGSPSEVPVPSVRVLPDGSRLQGLGPGLRYDVALTFIVDEGSVPEQLTVTLLEHTQRPSELDGDLGWYGAAPVARVTLDVAPLPATRPEPEGF